MTKREQIKVEELLRRMDSLSEQMKEAQTQMSSFAEEDKKWKEGIEQRLKPLVEERADRLVLQNAGKYFWKGVVALVVFVATLGAAVHYAPDIIKTFFRR